ncbi:hypothetical protein PG994_003294 [Apiospora phragmitis]|uniref:Uncharacterized protein n=1 Tax=Apiospora phragmitis TaxID=2905665 RepID=A0ABR1VXQ3_9PEZI
MKIQNGLVLRISDPNAVFSVGYFGAPFFTADDESPSISSFSGFPIAAPDPLSTAPLLPGDFVTFMGIPRGDEMIVFSNVAQNVQITTLNDLFYHSAPESSVADQRPPTQLQFVGYTSNSRAQVALYAIDLT